MIGRRPQKHRAIPVVVTLQIASPWAVSGWIFALHSGRSSTASPQWMRMECLSVNGLRCPRAWTAPFCGRHRLQRLGVVAGTATNQRTAVSSQKQAIYAIECRFVIGSIPRICPTVNGPKRPRWNRRCRVVVCWPILDRARTRMDGMDCAKSIGPETTANCHSLRMDINAVSGHRPMADTIALSYGPLRNRRQSPSRDVAPEILSDRPRNVPLELQRSNALECRAAIGL